ncbi:porin family protein [Aquimarina sp. I32.4]|uniref:porin family protein n=1 Tax=Aquimarina sp. I32.4 TaxID=2053903 RepID=UPI000CDE6240|nr:porin family protein [Aquimarina sp. I32.4]
MKKLFLLAIAIIGFSVSSNAQDIKFGFKGGLNFATLNGDNLQGNPDGRTGYHIGAVAQIGLAEKFALQPELLYSAQGVKDGDIDYINVPVLLKYKFAKIFSVEAGPQFGFVVNDNLDKAFGTTIVDIKAKNFDLSGAVGAGVEFGPFFGQLRYNFGVTNVFDVDNFDSKNSNFQVSVGYYIF